MSREGQLLESLFERISALEYCVLGGYETLPDDPTSDVDMWVAADDQASFREALSEVAADLGWAIVIPSVSPRLDGPGEGKFSLVNREDPDAVVQIDSWTYPYWRGIPYLDQEVIADHRRLERGFYVAEPGVEMAFSLVGDVLHRRELTERRTERAAECLDADDGSFEAALADRFGRDTAERVGTLARDGRWADLEASASQLRRALLSTAVREGPGRQLRRWGRYLWQGIRHRVWDDYGCFVAFVGPDGSGKTTSATGFLDSTMVETLFTRREFFYREFPVLPKMGELVAAITRREREDEPADDRETTPLPLWRSVLYPLYYGLNNVLAYVWLWRAMKGGGTASVLDRYFYEFRIQPLYSSAPQWLVRACSALVPEPDVLVFTTADTEVVSERADELPVDEIERQIEICERIVSRHPRGVTVETVDGSEAVVTEIQRAVLRELEEE